MIFLIDTGIWPESEVKSQCHENGIPFKGGFDFPQTCISLASLILKKHIAEKHGYDISDLKLSSTGKPYFRQTEFSLSHHGRLLVAVESTNGQPVGIDLTDRETPFTPGEQRSLWEIVKPDNDSVPDGIYWAAREAYLKYTGEGLRETPVRMHPPSHRALPDLENWHWSVMPLIKVENVLVRLFKVRNYVGALVAHVEDVQEVSLFSSTSN